MFCSRESFVANIYKMNETSQYMDAEFLYFFELYD